MNKKDLQDVHAQAFKAKENGLQMVIDPESMMLLLGECMYLMDQATIQQKLVEVQDDRIKNLKNRCALYEELVDQYKSVMRIFE